MPDVHVRMRIPLPVTQIVATPAMIFAHWLPLRNEDSVEAKDADLSIRLWFDPTCVKDGETATSVLEWANVLARVVNAEVAIEGVGDDLFRCITARARGDYDTAKDQWDA